MVVVVVVVFGGGFKWDFLFSFPSSHNSKNCSTRVAKSCKRDAPVLGITYV